MMSTGQGRPKRKAAAVALEAITGVRRPKLSTTFEFSGVVLPGDIMSSILCFLPKPELVHHASLVNSSWRAASESPVLWSCLWEEIWKKPTKANGGTMTSMKRFLALLRRPQFTTLKSLTPPTFIRRTTSCSYLKHMGKACPHLEELKIDLGNFHPCNDDELLLLPDCFPHLTKIKIAIACRGGRITQNAVLKLMRRLGESLVELAIYGVQVFSTETLGAMGQACPNLKYLFYMDFGSAQIDHHAAIEVIKTCSNLEKFVLCLPEEDNASMDVLMGMHEFRGNHGEECPNVKIVLHAHEEPVLVQHV